jgi:potassium efflux system protein
LSAPAPGWKVTQDHFWLTLRTVFWSILVASPLPVLWMTLGYGLQSAWPFPLAVAIGDGVTATVPLLWVVMICATFARPNGLFIAHFGWPRSRVAKAMRYYLMSIGLIVPLIMALIMFDNLNDREFSASLGRLCFLLICGALAVVTLSLKHAGIRSIWIKREWRQYGEPPAVEPDAWRAAGGHAGGGRRLSRHRPGAAGASGNLRRHLVPAAGGLSHHPPLDADPAPPAGLRPGPPSSRGNSRPARRGEDEPVHVSSPEGSVETEVSEVDLDAISTSRCAWCVPC